MSQIPNVNASSRGSASQQSFGSTSSLNDLDLDDFLDLMIAELQNQDPLNPLENDELVAQISQIREVGATDRLTATLDAVLLGQNISSATNLIGAEIEAISDDSQRVSGVVDSVSIDGGTPKLHLDLNPTARISDQSGEMDAGEYEYRVVWEEDGKLFGVDPLGGAIKVEGGQAVQISNLPVTSNVKHVYRTDGSGSGKLYLAGTITDGADATFFDGAANDQLSQTVLANPPQLVASQRSFSVSLSNVGAIRPPER